MDVIRQLPDEASSLPAKEQRKYLFLANRERLGAFLIAVTLAIGARVEFKGKVEVMHAIEAGIVLFLGMGATGLVAAGRFQSDDEHTQSMNRAIKKTTGQYPIVHPERREGDHVHRAPQAGRRR